MKNKSTRTGATFCSSMRPRSATTSWFNKFKLLALVLTTMLSVNVWGVDGSTHTSNVTFTAGTNGSTCSVVINATAYNGMKLGTSKKTGTMTFTIPKGTTKIHIHAAKWNGESGNLNISASIGTLGSSSITLTADAGVRDNSPFTLSEPSKATSNYYAVISISNVTAQSTITLTTSTKRAIVWGVNTEAAPSTYTLNFAVNQVGYGTVSRESLDNVASGTSISANGATLTVGGTDIKATPAEQTAQYTYAFSKWEWVPAGSTITAATTATATFTRTTRSYNVTPNLSNCSVSSGSIPATVEYGGTITATISASSGYSLPDEITVSGGTKSWNKNTGALSITDVKGAVSITITAVANANYYITGDAGLTGKDWWREYDEGKFINNKVTFTNVAAGNYQFKVSSGSSLIGGHSHFDSATGTASKSSQDGWDKAQVTLSCASDITFTLLDNQHVTALGVPTTCYVAGNGSGNWCGGKSWDAAGSVMTKNNGVHSVKFTNVAAGDYQFKVTNGTWNVTYGYSSADAGCSNTTLSNVDGNVKFTTTKVGDIIITFDGTKICVTVEPYNTVQFSNNGQASATSMPANQYVPTGGKVSEPSAPSLSGYGFGGWYKEQACTNAWNFSTDVVSTNTTLYAKWIPTLSVASVADVEITATPQGGSAILEGSNANVDYNKAVTLNYSNLTNGKVLTWDVYRTGDESTTVSVSGTGSGATFTMPAYPVTVSATIGNAPTWTITLNTGSGTLTSGTTEIVVVRGESTTLPSCGIECEDDSYGEWQFAGWKTGSNVSTITTATQTFVETNYTPSSDITLYAVYQAVDASGGSESKSSATSLGTGSSDYWGGVGNYNALNGNYIKFTCPANATSINEIQITANSFWANAGRMTITNNTKGTTVVSSFGPIKDNDAHTVLNTSVAVSAGDEIRFTGSGGTCNAKRIYVEWTEKSSITRYWSIPCNEKYTMTFHGVGGDASTIDWTGSLGSEDDYMELNATTITAYPTCATAETGWTFLGWRTSDYNDGKDLDEESASTENPGVASIYKNGKGYALNSGTTEPCGDGVQCVDMYPVFTKFVENEKPTIANLASGSKYYMYYTSDAGGYQDDYSNLDGRTTRIYAHEFSGNAFNSTTTCASAQLFEFTKRADGNWDIRLRNAADDGYESHSYIYTVADNTDLYAQAAQPDHGWVIETITIGGKTMVKMQYAGNTNPKRFMKVYDGGGTTASGTFKNYIDDCEGSIQYHAIYLGSCSNRIFSSNPGHAATWEVYGNFTGSFTHHLMTNGMLVVPNLAANTTYQFKLRKTKDDVTTEFGATASDNNYDASGVEWILDGESGGHYVNLVTGVAGSYTFIASRMSAPFPGITVTYPTAYTITFDGNGNDDGSMDAMTNLAMGEEISLTANEFTKTCNDFVEWNTNQDGKGTAYIDEGSVTVSGNMTLYAQWTPKRFDAIYDANGVTGYTGELPATVTYDCGDQVTIDQSKTLSKFGYTFIGWNTDRAATTPQPIETNPFTIDQGDTYIYAIWNAIKPTGIAIAPASGGNSPVKGTGVQMLVTLTPDASTMAEENREVTWSSSNTTYATVNQSGYVNFVGQGTVTITATSKVDGSIVDNYTFNVQVGSCDGWIISAYDNDGDNVTNDYFRQVGSSDEWRVKYVLPNGTRKFWVGGSSCAWSDHSDNWEFGWIRFKDRRDNKCENNTQYPGQDAVGELVIWSNSTDNNYGIAFLPNYKISYMTDGSNWRIMDFHSTSTQYSYETDIFQVPAGYKSNNDMEYFVGIEKNDGSNMFVDDGISSTDPMNGVNGLKEADMAGKYGKWHIWSNSCANNWYCEFNRYYQVQFEMNGGDGNIDPMYFYANDTESFNTNTLTNPTKTGYELTGWKDQEDHTYTTSESITVTKDLVLTAQWTARNYTITYNGLEDATNTNPGTYTIESAFDFVAPGERAGYTFVGWFDAATDGNSVTGITLGSTGDVIVWAHWNANSYSVTLNKNTEDVGSTDGSATFVYNTSAPTSYVAATRNGYNLAGYYTTQAASGQIVLNADGSVADGSLNNWKTDGKWTKANNDGVLYAKWSAKTGISYTVNHYRMDPDGVNYTLKEHIDGTGKTGDDKSSYALPKNYDGFATPEAQTLILTWPGPCVVNYYYERNKYELTWDFDGGTPAAGDYTQGQVYHGATITYPTNVTKDGFAFMRWDVNPATMPMEATTITAQWAEYTNYRTYCGNAVTFVANDGTDDEYVVTTDISYITAPYVTDAGFTRAGYEFIGWTKDGGDGTIIVPNGSTRITGIDGDVTYKALWIGIPTINEAVPVITSTNNVGIASAPRTLTVANPDGLEATIHIAYKKNGEAVEDATNSEFRFCRGGKISEGNITSTATSIATDFTIQYKPNAYNEIDTDYTLYITVTRKGSETVISSAEFNLKGRSLPEKFVIAVKNNSEQWLALPANMTSACTPEGMPITVTGEGLEMTADASVAAAYSLTGHNTIVKDSVFFKSAYNNGELWASKSAYTIYDNTTNVSDLNWNNYAWGLTPTDETLISYNVDNKNNGKNLRYYDNSKFGMYTEGEGTIYFIAVTSREETTAVVDEWYRNKILFHLPFAMKSVSMTINGVAIEDAAITIAERKIKTTNYVLYELGGNIDLVAASGQIMELTISDGMTEYVANISIPQIIVGEVDGCSALPAKADVVVRDGGHLTIDVEGALAKSFNNVTIYPNSKISVPEGKYFNVKNLTFFGGIDEMNGTETNIYAPELSLKGTMKTDTIVYRMRVNATHMMPVSFPYDVIIDSIKREDQLGSTSWGKVGTDIRLETYDGASRAAGNRRKSDESTWTEIKEGTLTAGIGYTVAAQYRFKNYLYTILDFPMANPYKKDAVTEVVKNAAVQAHEAVNWYDKGWNLMGNPYLAGITGDGAIKVNGTEYDFVYIPTADGEDYYQGPLATTHILPFMDFFVQVNEGGTMTFDLAKRVNAPKRMLAETERTAQFSISLTGANNTDITYFKVADNYTESYDIPGDNAKMFGSAVNTKVYSLLNSEDQLAQMAINADLTAQPIQLGYIAPENGEYIFAMDDSYRERENVEHIYLLENGNAVADLLTANFKFESVSGTNDGRFSIVIVMKSHQVTTEMINTLMDKDTKNPQKFIYKDHFYIMDTQQRIYDGTGKYVNTLENEK